MKNKHIQIQETGMQYFVHHANQRLTTFKFYITISIALFTGLGYLYANPQINNSYCLKISIDLALIAFAIIFAGLDYRNRILIKEAIFTLRKSEKKSLKKKYRIFWYDRKMKKRNISVFTSYGLIFNLVFLIISVIGVVLFFLTINNCICQNQ